MKDDTQHPHFPLWFALSGLLFGLLAQHFPTLLAGNAGNPTAWIVWKTPVFTAISLFFPLLLLLWKTGKPKRALPFLAILLAVAWWVGWQTPAEQYAADTGGFYAAGHFMAFFHVPLLLVVVGVGVTFVQAWQPQRPHFRYPDLFAHAWENVHTLALAMAFTLLTWLLLVVAINLFNSVLPYPYNVSFSWIEKNASAVISMIAFGVAMGVIQQYDGLLLRLHILVFALYNLLAYLMAFIILSFTLVLFAYWQTFLESRHAASTVLGLVFVSVLFLNTLVARGSARLPRWANAVFGAQLLVLPLLAALALYALGLRIGQYGLSPERMAGWLLGLLVLAYTVAYALQYLRYRTQWTDGIKTANIPLALLAAVTALLMLTPVLDPLGWSTRHQLARLQNGTVAADKFDYRALKNDFGKPGRDALATLVTWQKHPQYREISAQLDTLNRGSSAKTEPLPALEDKDIQHITVVPADKAGNRLELLRSVQNVYGMKGAYRECVKDVHPETECLLVYQDFDGNGRDEALLVGFVKTPGKPDPYRLIALQMALTVDNFPIRMQEIFAYHVSAAALQQAKAGQFTPVMPELPELMLGGERLSP